MSRVRISACTVPLFRHAGLVFGERWTACELGTLDAKRAACVRTYVGRFLRVHPEDRARFDAWRAGETEPRPAAVETEPRPAAAEAEPRPAAVEAEPRPVAVEAEPRPVAVEAERVEDTAAADTRATDADAPATARPSPDDYAGMSVNQLRDMATDLGIELAPGIRRKADIVKILEEHTT